MTEWGSNNSFTILLAHWHLNTILRMWFDLDPWGAGKSWKACSTISWDSVANIHLVSLSGHFPPNAWCPMGFIRRRRYLEHFTAWELQLDSQVPIHVGSSHLRVTEVTFISPCPAKGLAIVLRLALMSPGGFLHGTFSSPFFFWPTGGKISTTPQKDRHFRRHFTDNDFKRMLASRSWGCYSWKTAGIQ